MGCGEKLHLKFIILYITKPPTQSLGLVAFDSVLDRSRTCGLPLRRGTLYPAELQRQILNVVF